MAGTEVHGVLQRVDDQYFQLVFPFNGTTIGHVFNVAELDALKVHIDEIKSSPVGAERQLIFARDGGS